MILTGDLLYIWVWTEQEWTGFGVHVSWMRSWKFCIPHWPWCSFIPDTHLLLQIWTNCSKYYQI